MAENNNNSKKHCPNCHQANAENASKCDCGYFFEGYEELKENNTVTQNVVVTDIKMSFSSMVEFMVKWAIASIPALIILFFIGMALAGLIAGLGFSFFN